MAIDVSKLTPEEMQALVAQLPAELLKDAAKTQSKAERERVANERAESRAKVAQAIMSSNLKQTVRKLMSDNLHSSDDATVTIVIPKDANKEVAVKWSGTGGGGPRAESRDLKSALDEYGTAEEKAEIADLKAAEKAAKEADPKSGGAQRGQMTKILDRIWKRKLEAETDQS